MTGALPHRWPVITALGVVMVLTWGSTYYLLAVLAGPIADESGWSQSGITGAFSCGLLIAGLVSPLVGRRIERHGGRPILAIGAALIVSGLIILSIAQALWMFWAGWCVLGLGMAAGLYDPAFATLAQLFRHDARRAISLLTLLGGFASTICWPLSALMLEILGWRGTVMGYAAIHLLITLPLILGVIPKSPHLAKAKQYHAPVAIQLSANEQQAFLMISAIQVLHGLVVVNISVWLFTFLQAQGLTLAQAVAIGTAMGPAQVAARVLELANRERHHPLWTLTASTITVGCGLTLMAANIGFASLAIILFGIGNGLYSIARGALPLALFGEDRYASILGRLARPWLIAQAAAPTLGAMAIASLGTDKTLTILASVATVNILLLTGLWRASGRLS